MRFDLHHTFDRTVLELLGTILEQQEALMAAIESAREKIVEINASLDNIQADVNALLAAQANPGGMSEAEASEVVSSLNQIADKAAAIAAIVP